MTFGAFCSILGMYSYVTCVANCLYIEIGSANKRRYLMKLPILILLVVLVSRLRLRSANRHHLIVPRCRLSTYGRRAFSIASPTVWNSLPGELRDPALSFDSFRQFLKTTLFSLY